MSLYNKYISNFKCSTDGNNHGLINENVGLLTHDEVVYAGGYLGTVNNQYYLYNNFTYWLISPAGYSGSYASAYIVGSLGYIDFNQYSATYASCLRPVLNLKSDTQISSGDGSKDRPFIVE